MLHKAGHKKHGEHSTIHAMAQLRKIQKVVVGQWMEGERHHVI